MSYEHEPYEKALRDFDDPLKVDVALSIRLHQNGAMSIEGPVHDKEFCFKLLDEARACIKRQTTRQTLIVPGCDMDSKPKEAYQL